MSGISYDRSGRHTSIGNIGPNTKKWYKKNLLFENADNAAPKSEIYSTFSKKTEKSINAIKSRTQTRMEENYKEEKVRVIESLKKNEFIPH